MRSKPPNPVLSWHAVSGQVGTGEEGGARGLGARSGVGHCGSPACAWLCSQCAFYIPTPRALAPHKKSAHPGLGWSAKNLALLFLSELGVGVGSRVCQLWGMCRHVGFGAACRACIGQLALGTFVLYAAFLERICTPLLSFWLQESRGTLAVEMLCMALPCSNVVLFVGTLSAAAVWSYSAFGFWGFSSFQQCERTNAGCSHLEGSLWVSGVSGECCVFCKVLQWEWTHA